ncbi:hypothetical protein AX15_007036 [Amanita polypyramis BW_CC]|nr:hypothetical protein AX15_007036 [Amanita polypyramis BW_CC]
MDNPYPQYRPSRTLRKVKQLLVSPGGFPDPSGTDEPLSPQTYNQKDDDEKRHKAFQDLITVWQERLQLMSVISTFFASVESSMLTLALKTTLPMLPVAQIANAMFLGALIVHIFSAFVAFLASFLLIDYRIHETETELPRGMPQDRAKSNRPSTSVPQDSPAPMPSANPRLVQVGPFRKKPPLHLLQLVSSLPSLAYAASLGQL